MLMLPGLLIGFVVLAVFVVSRTRVLVQKARPLLVALEVASSGTRRKREQP